MVVTPMDLTSKVAIAVVVEATKVALLAIMGATQGISSSNRSLLTTTSMVRVVTATATTLRRSLTTTTWVVLLRFSSRDLRLPIQRKQTSVLSSPTILSSELPPLPSQFSLSLPRAPLTLRRPRDILPSAHLPPRP